MIVYADSSVIVRSVIPAESGSDQAASVLADGDTLVISSTIARLECTSAVVRAARHLRIDPATALAAIDALFNPETGLVILVDLEQAEAELQAIDIAREHGLRAMDAWHVACAELCFRELAEPNEALGFATRDDEQAEVARSRGWQIL
ncbi:type II toxin-antitoxin system VapC family toxin [Glaciibacter superstes]|uniref:type II toxin-antitoxin system VapC family toxin n=1 Tax=Glaciibacter superstes TaxID=501023 RepID=UPI0003B635EC|nr:type II toxin-antitoxin system VapC family toxin [Glaciibacter superstes]